MNAQLLTCFTCLFLLVSSNQRGMASSSERPQASASTQTLKRSLFSKVADGSIVNDGGDSRGGAWGDFNNDGWMDLMVPDVSFENNFLYRNEGDGTFEKDAQSALAEMNFSSQGAVWADFNNDGKLDLFVADIAPTRPNLLFKNEGEGELNLVENSGFQSDQTRTVNGAWGDFNNDGLVDLFAANNGDTEEKPIENNFLYRNNGDGTFERLTIGSIVNDLGRYSTPSWADYDNDGDIDLFVTTPEQSNRLYRNDGEGIFTKITNGSVVNDVVSSKGGAWGDYNNDGFLDLFVANINEDNFLYRNNADGTFGKVTEGAIVNDGGVSHACAWADYNNDGFLDLFVANRGNGKNFLYENNGDSTFTRIAQGSITTDLGNSVGAAWADMDNDGDLDLFVSNWMGENNALYINQHQTNKWLSIKCIGTHSNRSAIGTKIRIKLEEGKQTLWQMRQISGNPFRQNGLRVHFGLGQSERIDLMRIEWPSGFVQEFENLAPNQNLTITEPPILKPVGNLNNGEFELVLQSRHGFDYVVEASDDLKNWDTLSRMLNVNGSVQVVDPEGDVFDRRFYRAVQLTESPRFE